MDKRLTPPPYPHRPKLIIFTLRNFLSTFGDPRPSPLSTFIKIINIFHLLLFNLFKTFLIVYTTKLISLITFFKRGYRVIPYNPINATVKSEDSVESGGRAVSGGGERLVNQDAGG